MDSILKLVLNWKLAAVFLASLALIMVVGIATPAGRVYAVIFCAIGVYGLAFLVGAIRRLLAARGG